MGPISDRLDATSLLYLQRVAGNRRVAAVIEGLAVQRGGATAPTKVKHTEGKQVDTYADASPFLKKYVETKIKGGTKAEGHVHIHNAADFKKEWVKYAAAHTNPDTGKAFTKAEAEAWEPTVNAYQDSGEIHIHEERGETGTAIHESMHLYSSATYVDKMQFNMNEGTTEYFTKLLCKEQKITRGTFYDDQYKAVSKLVDAVGKDKLADAYFNGNIDDLKKAVDAKAPAPKKGEVAKSLFDTWVSYMKKGKYTEANALF